MFVRMAAYVSVCVCKCVQFAHVYVAVFGVWLDKTSESVSEIA